MYGLKQDPWAWYAIIDTYLQKLGFSKSEVDLNLHFKVMWNQPLILVLYVDDIFLIGEEILIDEYKRELTSDFGMKELGLIVVLSIGKGTKSTSDRFSM